MGKGPASPSPGTARQREELVDAFHELETGGFLREQSLRS